MNTPHSPTHRSHPPEWKTLGRLDASLRNNPIDTIESWLSDCLAPLNLQADFLNRVKQSALDAAARIISGTKFDHIHIMVKVPLESTSGNQTWGFFRVEKIDTGPETQLESAHTIEFYLYMESD